MSYYFGKLYNWYYDIHPWRPTMEDYKKKNMVVKQIKDMRAASNDPCASSLKQFKFKNRDYGVGKSKDLIPLLKKYEEQEEEKKVRIEIRNKLKATKCPKSNDDCIVPIV